LTRLTAHVRRHHAHRHTSGHVWQGRFKAFPIQGDEHLLKVIRYVERNALRAGLVDSGRTEDWLWGTGYFGVGRPRPAWLSDWPVARPRQWRRILNKPQTEAELTALRHSVKRGSPFGNVDWSKRIARDLGLESTLRPRGRPWKVE
jgi:putative transposase